MPMPITRPNLNTDQATGASSLATVNSTQFYDEYNRYSSFEICFHAQELVQELVQKCTSEFILGLRHLSRSVLIQDQHTFLLHKNKLDEVLRSLETILVRLRVSAGIINERKQALDRQQQQQQIDDSNKSEELKRLQKERDDLVEQVKLKNKYVKFAEEKIADIIWQINSIQTLRH